MKLTTLFLLVATLQVAASADAQQVSIRGKNLTLKSIFKAIRNQTGYVAIYEEQLIEKAKPVTLEEKTLDLKTLLDKCFANQSLTYTIREQAIIVKAKEEKKDLGAKEAAINKELPEKPEPPPTIDIRGIVKNERGEPVEGATVAVKGSTTKRTSTNAQGEFSLSGVDDKATLVISAVTIETLEVAVKNRVFIAIDVVNKVNDLDETVVVAYNTSTKRSNVGAVTVVKGEQIRDLPNMSVDKSLQGLVPGLLVTSGTGQPGGGLSNFVLRGIATSASATAGSTLRNPLIIIDGVPVSQENQQLRISDSDVPIHNPMSQLNPSDIESISVLKDAAAIALYGSQASNGVIIITTKLGKSGKTKFSFSNRTDILQRLKGKVDLVNYDEYMELLLETYKNSDPTLTNTAIINTLKSIFLTRADGSFYPFQELADKVYTRTAITSSNNFSMSGGNERSNFYLGLEWTKQNGTYRGTALDRKSLRYNFSNRVADWIKISMNNTLSYSEQDYSTTDPNDSHGFINSSAPLNPIYLEDGSLILNYTLPFTAVNPIAAIQLNKSKNTSYRGLSSFSSEFSFLRQFKFSSSLGVDFQLTEAKEKRDPRLFDADATSGNSLSGRITEGQFRSVNIISTNKLSYSKLINKSHSISGMLSQEARINTRKNTSATGIGLIFPYFDQIDNATTKISTGNEVTQTLLSYFGQVNYDFKKKYFASASARFDADSKFGSNERFGSYWAFGVGWIASEEPFISRAGSWLNYLKLRGSLGVAGNSGAINRFTKYTRLTSISYLNDIAVFPGAEPFNPNIKWEETFSWDIGIESNFWNERINLIIDLYQRNTSNLLSYIDIPQNSGFNRVLSNVGDMLNKGVEVNISAKVINFKNFNWVIGAQWSTNQNRLVKSNLTITRFDNFLSTEPGKNYNSYFLPVWAGVDPITGLGTWIDQSGKPNSNYSAAKREYVGSPTPDGFGSILNTIKLKGVQLDIRFFYQYGNKVYIGTDLIRDGGRPFSISSKDALDRWRKPGDNASNPRPMLNNASYSNASTRRLYDGDYIRLQNVTLSYLFTDRFIKKLRLSGLRVYVQANNLAIWTKAKGRDLNDANISGQTGTGYPNSKAYSIGLNVDF